MRTYVTAIVRACRALGAALAKGLANTSSLPWYW